MNRFRKMGIAFMVFLMLRYICVEIVKMIVLHEVLI